MGRIRPIGISPPFSDTPSLRACALLATAGASLVLLGWTSDPTDAALQAAPPSHEAPRSLTDVLSSRLRFEENVGQANDRFAFVARARGYDVGISRAGLEVRVPGEAPAPARTVRLVFGDGGGHLATLVGEERLRSRAHYLHVGDGPAFHAAHFGRVQAR